MKPALTTTFTFLFQPPIAQQNHLRQDSVSYVSIIFVCLFVSRLGLLISAIKPSSPRPVNQFLCQLGSFRNHLLPTHAHRHGRTAGAPKCPLCFQWFDKFRLTTSRIASPLLTVPLTVPPAVCSLFIRQLSPYEILRCSPVQWPKKSWQDSPPRSKTWRGTRGFSQR
jgi:hypothetical protein